MWAPKPLPAPETTFPLTLPNGTCLVDWTGLLRYTGPGLPTAILLSPYYHIRRMMLLSPASGLSDASRPLFQSFDGKPIDYLNFSKFVNNISELCGHKYITPHSGRIGGMTAAGASGMANSHDLQQLGYMSQHATTLVYDRRTTQRSCNLMLAMSATPFTDTQLNHAFGRSDFVGPRPESTSSFGR